MCKLQQVVNSRLHGAENERFLEHFRYTIIASTLLNDHPAHGRPAQIPAQLRPGQPEEYSLVSWSVNGVAVATTIPFAIAWLTHWAMAGHPGGLRWSRLLVLVAALVMGLSFLYVYVRKQRLHSLRQEAVRSLKALVTNVEALEMSSSTALTMVQEVELVSRGFRLSTPLPPISRLDENPASGESRRLLRIRRLLHKIFADSITTLIKESHTLRALVSQDDLDKYLDIYEVSDATSKKHILAH